MKKFGILLIVFLAGCIDLTDDCSSATSDSEECITHDSDQNTGGNEPKETEILELSDLVGVWDNTQVENQATDVSYRVVKDNGEVIIYDYLNDSFNNGGACYTKSEPGQLTHTYEHEFEYIENGKTNILSIQLEGNTAYVNYITDNVSYSFSHTKSPLQESDFTPICDTDVFNPTDHPASLSEITGTWTGPENTDDPTVHPTIFSIDEDGNMPAFSWFDPNEESVDCYFELGGLKLTDNANGDFTLTQTFNTFEVKDSYFIMINGSGDVMTLSTYSEGLGQLIVVMNRISNEIDDVSPVCWPQSSNP